MYYNISMLSWYLVNFLLLFDLEYQQVQHISVFDVIPKERNGEILHAVVVSLML